MKNTAKELIKQMTLQEKIALVGGSASMLSADCERLGVPKITFADGPLGVRIEQGYEENCTGLPCATAMAATWNKELLKDVGEAIANDCIKNGKDVILGPAINIKRTPLCGRNFEYFSEDPVLAGKLGAEYIKGVESKGVGTCVKHFAANNQEMYRGNGSSEVDERTLREIYLKAFEIAVKESNPMSIMCAYNRVNGIRCTENPYLMKDVVRNDWKYKGVLLSDWYGVTNAWRALKQGLNLQMPYMPRTREQLLEGLEQGKISEALIDEAIEPLVEYAISHKKQEINYDRDWQHNVAKQTAAEGVVLLKNEDNILPINPKKHKKVTVIGEYAKKPVYYGYGSARVYSNKDYVDTPLESLKKNLGDDVEVTYIEGYLSTQSSDRSIFYWRPGFKDGGDAIKNADVVLMFIGTPFGMDTEAADRAAVTLEPYYYTYIESVSSLNKNLVLVMQNGSAIIPYNWTNQAKGIVEMWFGGEANGSAVADVLCGKMSPCGKLPETFPKCMRSDLDYPGDGYKVKYDEKWAVGYRYYDLHPEEIAYPFGFGLSYTQFEYSDLSVIENGDKLDVSFMVKNIGEMSGKEIAQIYVSDKNCFASRPKKELKEFYKTRELKPNETEKCSVSINIEELGYFNINIRKMFVEPGVYDILIGASSRDIRLNGKYIYNYEGDFTITSDAETGIG